MVDKAKVIFLGWDDPVIDKAVEWLVDKEGWDLGSLDVALPGRRAGRLLKQGLARRADEEKALLIPPHITTAGHLTDRLLLTQGKTAGHTARRVLWAKALMQLGQTSPKGLGLLTPYPPAEGDLAGWMNLSSAVSDLHGKYLAPGRLSFQKVADVVAQRMPGPEAERWSVLVDVQTSYQDELKKHGLVDPHDARLEALASKTLHPKWFSTGNRVVLIGVAQLSHLLRGSLECIEGGVTALVAAPESEAEGFDDMGTLRPGFWGNREIPLSDASWLVGEGPAEQARCVAGVLAGWNDRFGPEQITLGIPDEEVVPYLERRLSGHGLVLRHGTGTELKNTPVYRFLETVVGYLSDQRYSTLAALLRHPLMDGRVPEGAIEAMDDSFNRHLPDQLHESKLTRDGTAVQTAVDGLLKDFLGKPRALSQWASPVRELLHAVYGDRELDPADAKDAEEIRTLSKLGDILGEIDDLGLLESDLPPCTSGEGLGLILDAFQTGVIMPPSEGGAVEMMGWLELALDDAPALVVTGFNDGKVPALPIPNPFLSEPLQTEIGIPGRDERVARDVQALLVMLHSKKEVRLISGRRSADGDPLLPSRLAFHLPESSVSQRVKQWLDPVGKGNAEEGASKGALVVPCRPEPVELKTMSATDFGAYLECPYHWYLSRYLRLSSVEDRARELDAALFGTLAHEVLEQFGVDESVRDSVDEREINASLQQCLKKTAASRFGRRPRPMVRIQIERLGRRLSAFAAVQARHAGEGWRIRHVEWSPEDGGLPFQVDDQPVLIRGKIDRIDVHEDGRWAVIDYKTSSQSPEQAHRKGRINNKAWKNLQLPLYGLLAGELGLEDLPSFGYALLPADLTAVRFDFANWTEEDLEDALEVARVVVRRIRNGDYLSTDGFPRWDRGLGEMAGLGLLAGQEVESNGEMES